jgi:hypothetical protein
MDSIRVAAIGLAGVVIGALITGYFQWWSSKQQTDTRLVEMAIGVLRAQPKEEEEHLKALRNWAIKVVEDRSGTQFSEKEREALQKYALPYEPKFLPLTGPNKDKYLPWGVFEENK